METSRRHFLQLARNAAIGVAAGMVEFPADKGLVEAAQKITHKDMGNASVNDELNKLCPNQQGKEECYQKFIDEHKSEVIFEGPFMEELIFRAGPSGFLSTIEYLHPDIETAKHPIEVFSRGTGGIKMNRREMLLGTVTSLVFGASHNLTEHGFDTKKIPLSQTIGGMMWWYLHRKFGMAANLTSHMTHNWLASRHI